MGHPDYPNHPVRLAEEQSIHDSVIQRLKEQLQKEGFGDVWTNPGYQKPHTINCDSRKLWPDVFTVKNDRVASIYEVETVSTVDAGAADQWEDYSSCAHLFYLVVPKSLRDKAENILRDRRIRYDKILTYFRLGSEPCRSLWLMRKKMQDGLRS
jgi:hypothetical protein